MARSRAAAARRTPHQPRHRLRDSLVRGGLVRGGLLGGSLLRWSLVAGLGMATLAACSDAEETPTNGATTSSTSTSTGSTGTGTASPTGPAPTAPAGSTPRGAETVAQDIAVPWGIGFLPDGTAVVTERDTGRVLLLPPGDTGVTRTPQVAATVEVETSNETGLLGVAVSPDFAQDSTLFLYLTTPEDNRVVRGTLNDRTLGDLTPVLTGIPSSFNHDGGRMTFGPDGLLYISTGDALEPELAQDTESLAGKILRITPEGEPAPGNPFDNEVLSLGHRNVQGLAFDDDGNLWASEFGEQTQDELNLISAGNNYGWPVMEGTGVHDGAFGTRAGLSADDFTAPHATWSTDENSPSGLAFHDGRLWLASLRGQRLWSVPVEGTRTGTPTAHFVGEWGRLRTVIATPDGELWISTSNRDGRVDPKPDDDHVLQVQFGS